MSVLAIMEAPAALVAVPDLDSEPATRPCDVEPEQPVVVVCPAWCERGDEHVDAADLEHWTREREIDGDQLTASMITRGGCEQFEIRLSDHAYITLCAEEAGKLIGVLAELLALSTHSWTEKTMLPAVTEGDVR